MNFLRQKKTEKNILIALGVMVLTLLGMFFLSFANSDITQKIKASISSSETTNNSNTTNNSESPKPVYIEKGYILGGNTLYRGGEARLSLGLSSEGNIKETQSIEVEMVQGTLNITNYDQNFSHTRFILNEFVNTNEVSKIMENHGGKNWAAVYINLNIPDYSQQQMPNGEYTIVASVHRDNNNTSQIFIPIILKDSTQSCDINSDGFENMIDIILSLKIMNGEITPSAEEREKLDSNRNGIIDLVDTLTIFKCVLDPKPSIDTYFENYCKKSIDPIDILLCPDGKPLPNIRHIQNVEITDAEGNTSTQTQTSYSPDPITTLFQ